MTRKFPEASDTTIHIRKNDGLDDPRYDFEGGKRLAASERMRNGSNERSGEGKEGG